MRLGACLISPTVSAGMGVCGGYAPFLAVTAIQAALPLLARLRHALSAPGLRVDAAEAGVAGLRQAVLDGAEARIRAAEQGARAHVVFYFPRLISFRTRL